jgi:hypothetical protein
MSKAGAQCFRCRGEGLIRIGESSLGPREWVKCERCCGTGMECIPWPELFKGERSTRVFRHRMATDPW